MQSDQSSPHIKPKPVYITLKKNGNNFVLGTPQLQTGMPSKIPILNLPTQNHNYQKSNGFDTQGVKNVRASDDKLMPVQPNQFTYRANGHQSIVKGFHSQLPIHHHQQQQQQPEHHPCKTLIPVNIKLIPQQKVFKPLPETNRATSSRDFGTIALESKTISKQKALKRPYKRKQPTGASDATPKFNFPLPPPKIQFTVTTDTVFKTAVDDVIQPPSSKSIPPVSSENSFDEPNGVPFDCPTFKKILIDTTASRNNKIVVAKGSISSDVQIASESQDEPSDGVSFAETPATVDNPVAEPSVTVSEKSEYAEIINRLDRLEQMQLASSKREAQILVAVKKLCLQYTKHNNENDEIKKLMPMRNEPALNEIDTRIIEDPVFKDNLIAFLRGYKTTNNPENFTSFFNVLVTDELVAQFNLKGILGKKKLEGYKIMEIIQDLHKPMDKKTFEKLMRNTIELSKNRFHNEQYRKRQQQKLAVSSSSHC